MYAKVQNGAAVMYPYTLDNLKQDNPQVSFPRNPSDDVLAEYGVFPVASTIAPAHDPTTQVAEQNGCIYTGDQWETAWTVRDLTPEELPNINDLAQAKLTAINEGKNAALDGGFVHDGKLFDSDSKARLAYLELSLKFGQDPTYSTPWKASAGQWVMMTAALFAALQPAYEAHIAGCFAWQRFREVEVATAVAADDVEALAEVVERI